MSSGWSARSTRILRSSGVVQFLGFGDVTVMFSETSTNKLFDEIKMNERHKLVAINHQPLSA